MPSELIAWSIIALFIAVVLLVLLVGCVLLWKVVRWILRHGTPFGDSLEVRLVALALLSICGRKTLAALLEAPFRLLLGLVGLVSSSLAQIVNAHRNDSEPDVWGLASEIVSAVGPSVNNLLMGAIYDLRLEHFVRLLGGWVVVGKLLSLLTRSFREGESRPTATLARGWARLVASWPQFSARTRQNFLLGVLLSIGSYLSITAVIMVPWLREGVATEALSAERFQQRLAGVSGDTELGRLLPEVTPQQPSPLAGLDRLLAQMRQAVAPIEALPPTTTATTLPSEDLRPIEQLEDPARRDAMSSLTEQLAYELGSVRQDYESAYEEVRRNRQDALDRITKARGVAEAAYLRATTLSLSQRERQGYFEELFEWFRQQANAIAQQHSYRVSSLQSRVALLVAAAASIEATYRHDMAAIAAGSELPVGGTSGWQLESLRRLPRSSYLPTFTESTPPPLPSPGRSWGIFGWISGWLLRTQSLALTLIVGMIGFGILGSAVSTFVRERRGQKGQNEGLVRDVGGVAIRGASAAIVVYLAVVGGLSVFATDVENPNPYALFLTCLIGAVFSERIWGWAIGYLDQQTGKSGATSADVDDGLDSVAEPKPTTRPSPEGESVG